MFFFLYFIFYFLNEKQIKNWRWSPQKEVDGDAKHVYFF